MSKRALITGITGQDGSYLAELLLGKGYEVHGLIRRASTFNTSRIDHLYQDPHDTDAKLFLHYGDLSDGARLVTLLHEIDPDEVYNLAAQSHVRVSFDEPEHTGDTTGIGAMRLLEAVRLAGVKCRYYQASSSEMFGATPPPQNEETPFYPRSPYGAAKVYAYWVTKNYREGYGMFAVNGILFNHESPRRGETFVTRKVTRAVARIQAGLDDYVYMGNLDSVRDWGYAPEYVEGMWRMLQSDKPDDYVLATGGNFTVRDFLVTAFEHAGLDWEKHVRFDERYLRPTEVDALVGDASKAERDLGWKAQVDTESWPGSWWTRTSRRSSTRASPGSTSPSSTVGRSSTCRSDDRGVSPGAPRPRCGLLHRRAPRSRGVGDLAEPRDAGLHRSHGRDVRRAGPEGPRRGLRLLRRDQAEVRRARGREGRRDHGEQHLPRRLPQREPADPAQRDGRGPRRRGSSGCSSSGSSCIYPKLAPQPIHEDSLLTGHLEPTNDAYAIAKIAGILQVQAVRRQHGLPWISAMPTNLYGPGDNFSPQGSHVLPALIRRYDEAVAQAPARSPTGGPVPRAASSCMSTTWPTPACTCWSTTTVPNRSTSARVRTRRSKRSPNWSLRSWASRARPGGTPASPTARPRSSSM